MPNPSRALWRQVIGASNTIKTVYVGALTLYSIVGTTFLHGWANVVAVACNLVLVPASVVLIHVLSAPKDPLDQMLNTPARVRAPLEDEIRRATQQGLTTWWTDSSLESRWFDNLYVFWWKARGVPADSVRIVLDSPPLTSQSFAGVPTQDVAPPRPDRKKAALVRASTFLSDVPPTLNCAPLDYELNMWVDRNGSEFRRLNNEASLFGVEDWTPYPGILCTHNVLMTSGRCPRTAVPASPGSCRGSEPTRGGRQRSGSCREGATARPGRNSPRPHRSRRLPQPGRSASQRPQLHHPCAL